MDLPSSPTTAQLKAGNYRKAHTRIAGMDIAIENQQGTFRRGKNENGTRWKTLMQHDYGYIKGTVGRDKDHIDCFIGPNPKSELAFVVNQRRPKTGEFDEHKVMLGFDKAAHAKSAYHANYQPGWKGYGGMAPMSMARFKQWAFDGVRKMKPVEFADCLPATRLVDARVIPMKQNAILFGAGDAGSFLMKFAPKKATKAAVKNLHGAKATKTLYDSMYAKTGPAVKRLGARLLDIIQLAEKEEPWYDPAVDATKDALKDSAKEAAVKPVKHWLIDAMNLGAAELDAGGQGQIIKEWLGRPIYFKARQPDDDQQPEGFLSRNKYRIAATVAAVPAALLLRKHFAPIRTGFTADKGTPGYEKLAQDIKDKKFAADVAKAKFKKSKEAAEYKQRVNRAASARPANTYEDKDGNVHGRMLSDLGDSPMLDESEIPKVGDQMEGDEVATVARSQDGGSVNVGLKGGKTLTYKIKASGQKFPMYAGDGSGGGCGTTMADRLTAILFNEQSAAFGNRFGPGDSPLSAYRRARRLIPAIRRTGDVAQDLGDMAEGKKKAPGQKRFYQKQWFKDGVVAAALGGGIWKYRQGRKAIANQTGRATVDYSSREPVIEFGVAGNILKWAKANPRAGAAAGTAAVVGGVLGIQKVKNVLRQRQFRKDMDAYEITENARRQKAYAAGDPNWDKDPEVFKLGDRLTAILFDDHAALKGWDVRDPRGRSARVFAPGSKKRERREKTQWETTAALRLERNVAIGAAALGGVGLGAMLLKNRAAKQVASEVAGAESKAIPRAGVKWKLKPKPAAAETAYPPIDQSTKHIKFPGSNAA